MLDYMRSNNQVVWSIARLLLGNGQVFQAQRLRLKRSDARTRAWIEPPKNRRREFTGKLYQEPTFPASEIQHSCGLSEEPVKQTRELVPLQPRNRRMKIANCQFPMVRIICQGFVILVVTVLITACHEKEIVRCAIPDRHLSRQVHLHIEMKLQNLSRFRSADRTSIVSHSLPIPRQDRGPCSGTGHKPMVKLHRPSLKRLGNCTSNGCLSAARRVFSLFKRPSIPHR